VKPKPSIPSGHGELLEQPPYPEWHSLLESNRSATAAWRFEVAGMDAVSLRDAARAEVMECASDFSVRLGVSIRPTATLDAPLIVTGHQPELFHPGVWVKDFLLQRFADENAANAVDLVVDSDGFETLSLTAPCLVPEPTRCVHYLAIGAEGSCYATTPVPPSEHVVAFCDAVAGSLAGLSSPAPTRHFADFCSHLKGALSDVTNLGEVITFARRRFEASAGTDYHELPVTRMARGAAYARFVVHLARNARDFAASYNRELDEYRTLSRTRSKAQPFPDLVVDEASVELPLWRIADGVRAAVFVQSTPTGSVMFSTAAGPFLELPADPDSAVAALIESGETCAPKALALTMFVRLFVADLFIHGVGGGRYDRITDGVIRRFFGIEPPRFTVASLTVYLPLGAHLVDERELSDLRERINRLEHNPDAALGEAEFETPEERSTALSLAVEKARLVAAIALPDADRKSLGLRIRVVNAELAAVMSPLRTALEGELRMLQDAQRTAEVLTDRTYPFCLWDPADIADKVW
jgi:hypothetical protein